MPFVDEEKLAELYKEMDKESKSSVYFQSLYLKYIAKITLLWVISLQKKRLRHLNKNYLN